MLFYTSVHLKSFQFILVNPSVLKINPFTVTSIGHLPDESRERKGAFAIDFHSVMRYNCRKLTKLLYRKLNFFADRPI